MRLKNRTTYKTTVPFADLCSKLDQLSFPSHFFALIGSILIKHTREDGQNPCDYMIHNKTMKRFPLLTIYVDLCQTQRDGVFPRSALGLWYCFLLQCYFLPYIQVTAFTKILFSPPGHCKNQSNQGKLPNELEQLSAK